MVWAWFLRVSPLENVKVGIESTIRLGGIIVVAWFKSYVVITVATSTSVI